MYQRLKKFVSSYDEGYLPIEHPNSPKVESRLRSTIWASLTGSLEDENLYNLYVKLLNDKYPELSLQSIWIYRDMRYTLYLGGTVGEPKLLLTVITDNDIMVAATDPDYLHKFIASEYL